MQPEAKKYLYDVLKACEAILDFVKDTGGDRVSCGNKRQEAG